MTVRPRHIAVAAVLTAAAIAVPVAALATGSSTPPAKPSPVATGSAAARLPGLAASAGLDARHLQAGLVAAKRAGGNTSAGVAAFAAAAGVSERTAQRILDAVVGTHTDRSLTGPAAATALAARLGVDRAAAGQALRQLSELSGRAGIDPASSTFAAIAHRLHVSPARLAAALDGVKRAVAGG